MDNIQPDENLDESNTSSRWYLNFKKRGRDQKTLRTASKATLERIFHLIQADNPKLFIAGTNSNPPSRHHQMLQKAYANAKDDIKEPESDHDIIENYTMKFDSENAFKYEEWCERNINNTNRYPVKDWTLESSDNSHNSNNRNQDFDDLEDEFDPSQSVDEQDNDNDGAISPFSSPTQPSPAHSTSEDNDKEEVDLSEPGENDNNSTEDNDNPEPSPDLVIVDQAASGASDDNEISNIRSDQQPRATSEQQSGKNPKPNPIIPMTKEARTGYYNTLKQHCQQTVNTFMDIMKQGKDNEQARLNATHGLIRYCVYHNLTTRAKCVQNAFAVLTSLTDDHKVLELIAKIKKEEKANFIKKKYITKDGIPIKRWVFDVNKNFGVQVNKPRKKRRLPSSFHSIQPPQKRGRLTLSKSISNQSIPTSPISSIASSDRQRSDPSHHMLSDYAQINYQNSRNINTNNNNNRFVNTNNNSNVNHSIPQNQIDQIYQRLSVLESKNNGKPNPAVFEIREMVNKADRGFQTLGVYGVDKEPTIEACVKRANSIISRSIDDKATQKINALLNHNSNEDLTRVLEGLYFLYLL